MGETGMIRVSLFALALCAAACTPAPQEPAPPTEEQVEDAANAMPQNAADATAQDTCGASRFTHLVGTLASEIDQATLPAGSRIVTPDALVTQDFRPDRLNVMVGTDGRVGSLSCY
jgi:hypothetical protein